MTNEVAVQNEWTAEQINLIKSMVCKGATDDEFKLFLYFGKKTGLDPLAKQYHFVKRWNNQTQKEEGTIQTGIDGLRLVAERTNKYAGSSEPIYVIDEKTHLPISATVKVRKLLAGTVHEVGAIAFFSEYVQKKKDGTAMFLWAKMPFLMIGKCAEALALRKAFPDDLSSIYADEEMQQADSIKNVEAEIVDKTTMPKIDQIKNMTSPAPATTSIDEKLYDNVAVYIKGLSIKEADDFKDWIMRKFKIGLPMLENNQLQLVTQEIERRELAVGKPSEDADDVEPKDMIPLSAGQAQSLHKQASRKGLPNAELCIMLGLDSEVQHLTGMPVSKTKHKETLIKIGAMADRRRGNRK